MTTETKHTAGKWYVSGTDKGPARRHLHIGAEGSPMVLASMNHVHTDTVANAALIASAPDLLAALELIDSNAAESVEWIRRVARAAIRKSTGEA